MMKINHNLVLPVLLFFRSSIFGQSDYLYNFNPDSLRFKILKATRCSSPPKIDGNSKDDVWEGAFPINDFFQIEPKELTAPSENTSVK